MAPILIALAILIYIILGLGVVSLLVRIGRVHRDSYLDGRLDQQQWDRITELASVMGGPADDPVQVFLQQLDRRAITLDLRRVDLGEWDGHDRLSLFSEI